MARLRECLDPLIQRVEDERQPRQVLDLRGGRGLRVLLVQRADRRVEAVDGAREALAVLPPQAGAQALLGRGGAVPAEEREQTHGGSAPPCWGAQESAATRRRILPMFSPSSMRWWAAAASSSGNSESTIARISPSFACCQTEPATSWT